MGAATDDCRDGDGGRRFAAAGDVRNGPDARRNAGPFHHVRPLCGHSWLGNLEPRPWSWNVAPGRHFVRAPDLFRELLRLYRCLAVVRDGGGASSIFAHAAYGLARAWAYRAFSSRRGRVEESPRMAA